MRRKNHSNPIVQLSALVAGSAATLAGVLRGLEPDEILVRAVVAAAVVAGLAWYARTVLRLLLNSQFKNR